MTSFLRPCFSLIVATYGRADVLAPLVTSLIAQSCRDFEVIVADQNKDDRVAPLLRPLAEAGLLGTHLRLDRPNLSFARNAGLAVARGRFVAFPDDDCWYDPDTLARGRLRLDGPPALDGLAARWYEAAPEPGDEHEIITRDAMRRFRGGNVASITLFLSTDAVRRAGGFDERIGVGRWYGAGEETDLVLALVAQGSRIAHAPEVVVHHSVDDAPSAEHFSTLVRRTRLRARGAGALYAKHKLPAWVIARGLVRPLFNLPGRRLAEGVATSVGRLEGFISWSFEGARAAPSTTSAALAASSVTASTKKEELR